MYLGFQTLEFPSLKRITKKDDVVPQLKDTVQQLRNTAKDNIEGLQTKFFARPLHEYMYDLAELAPLVKTLVQLVKTFAERFYAMKKEKLCSIIPI